MSPHTEITDLLDGLAAAWNAGDATAYAAAFTEDADYISFDGRHARGRAAIESAHRWLFDGPLKGSIMAATTGQVRPLADGAALVVSEGGTAVAGGPHRPSIVSLTAVRTPGGWRFASFQNTRVAA
ncbi:SgcJ/EcaC family oxidoreductase [Actinomadura sp. WMMB 499]|uniref:SgcJ/EcaC family oxidoreductase n=1 Tax=Actinomadura sp. WMMB 499 TaxID=1219491 RepID=UPI001244662F|nr:SgcJ/EcaC family oxidoreductase [Actinomadura sp. WMMB 499]QFG20994.1 SgcJ/EcaC family oxidoreductase [Actinomadura sp. WMMB 499]